MLLEAPAKRARNAARDGAAPAAVAGVAQGLSSLRGQNCLHISSLSAPSVSGKGWPRRCPSRPLETAPLQVSAGPGAGTEGLQEGAPGEALPWRALQWLHEGRKRGPGTAGGAGGRRAGAEALQAGAGSSGLRPAESPGPAQAGLGTEDKAFGTKFFFRSEMHELDFSESN